MAKYLVIVESPAKVKTIRKFLGSSYEVMASNGHVRDLPKSSLGIDVEHDYEPKYITIRGKGELLAGLRRAVKKADKIYLATDPDREGEAISWHLLYALKLEEKLEAKKVYRITFNEITKNAVKESLKNAREIDMNLVDAQQARRMLDRMVGYRISPLLWEKIKRGLSAGRVQSVTLRIICDREEEINAFIPEEYWTLDVFLKVKGERKSICAKYYGTKDGKQSIVNKEQADAIMNSLKGAEYSVREVKKSERMKKAPLPFTTSTLQQEAGKVLNFSTQKTMRLAQQLYEGVDIKGEGMVGLITYLRTDSTRVSQEAAEMAAKFITAGYGEAYLHRDTGEKKNNQKIQDAHEAIRPTDLNRTPAAVKEQLPRDLFRLYQLIWKRFVASRMSAAKYDTTSVKIQAKEQIFTLSSSSLSFDGFLCVYRPAEEGEEENALTAALSRESELSFESFDPRQHFTQPPAHYTESSLVKDLEELGIGRPSTYAPTIGIILARHYVVKEGRNLYVTELGEVVNNMMKQAFPAIVDVNFTASMEALLDSVEEGTVKWKTVVANFYPDLDAAVDTAEKLLAHISIEDEVSDETCDLCGRQMVIKYGPHGRFLACPGFPECRNTKPYFEKTGVSCPKCGKDVVMKKTRKGRKYYGCIDNPDCDFMVWQKPSGETCPKCGSALLIKGNKLVCADQQCGYQVLSELSNKA
ncbi:type I DNA topoisomerase [Acetatifactor muris]|uniref:DNA topoisomerase 1 n=1 Tax=Acetatifactor muris TaxID=879566 RepID=A0A2K4ZIJ0_9FIRM|nr:type I DNA topoisomerase [Acetatifactor muris]MCI8798965.1 type I DNA topoisomerase [Lachnospiraceae bacterium]MCR2048660.1 type I DNA topoisomerase [Acetatifactor muris]SOY30280.1 DNA topoisomerase 1 [Acetatifactor muris]